MVVEVTRRREKPLEEMTLAELQRRRAEEASKLSAAQQGYGNMEAISQVLDKIDALIEQRMEAQAESEETPQNGPRQLRLGLF